ncbi:hypothetical protein F5148DRAFT_1287813 [Russula earlei]|uniref:Uncharacterized protein n=1 Tax=Russula earlei TaxID=71964 RepID=A0ACC0U3A4_9AGAM|nr:hypothetical protein F5148DRAFT_1287813 [Russula earlei]
MDDINPHLAKRNPHEAPHALKAQFTGHTWLVSSHSITNLLDNEDSDVLVALAVKIFSAMPVSMVNKHAMSVVTWLNSPRQKQQKVPTIANHLIIQAFNQLNREEQVGKGRNRWYAA